MNARAAVAAVLVAIAIFSATGCSKRGAAGGPTDSFTFAQQWEPQSLNPALEDGDSSQEWGLLLFSYLVKYDASGKLQPDIATVVPSVANGGISADGLTVTYHLRAGVKFSDGTPLTADDAAWSVDAINNRNNNAQSRFGYDEVASATPRDSLTLVLRLKHPFAPLISTVLAPQGFPILPKHLLARYPNFNNVPFNLAPVGSGPYVVRKWLHGDRVMLERNPHFWGPPPAIAHLTVAFVANTQTVINMLQTKESQGYFNSQDPSQYSILQTIPGYRAERVTPPDNGVGALVFNTRDPIVGDANVRHALAEAIDIPAMIAKTYRGAEETHQAARGLFLWAYDPAAYPDIPYDPQHARKLLEAAGWHAGPDGYRYKNGRRLDLLMVIQAATPGDAVIGEQTIDYERAVGAAITLKAFNVTQFVSPAGEGGPVYGGHFQIALYPFENGNDPDTTDQFACANVPPNGYNKSRICDPQIDVLLQAGRTTYDPAQRAAIYAKLEALLYARLPIAIMYDSRQINAWSDRLTTRNGGPLGAFWNAANWQLGPPASP